MNVTCDLNQIGELPSRTLNLSRLRHVKCLPYHDAELRITKNIFLTSHRDDHQHVHIDVIGTSN